MTGGHISEKFSTDSTVDGVDVGSGPQVANASQPRDAELLMRVARQNDKAFAELYRRHAGAVYARAWQVVRDRHGAEDVVQEVFLRLWEHPQRVDHTRGTLRTYLLLDAQGRGGDLVRARSRRDHREDRMHRLMPDDPYDLETEIEHLMIGERVRDALRTLPSAERRALELAYFGRQSYRQVATLLRVPEGTVKGRIRAGLVRLRDTLAVEVAREPWLVS